MHILKHPTSLMRVAVIAFICCLATLTTSTMKAQQTLGGITGEVADASGAVIPNAAVTVLDEHTGLTRTTKTNASGVYLFVNLPIGEYTLTFTANGFEVQKTQHISVQADRTVGLNAGLKVGSTGDTVTVEATPLMNTVDTTVGYTLGKEQIDEVPLSTGSFTGLATQSVGVNAELSGGTGANSGLGNAPIWANGQRDTSNSFVINGVDASNLFNGKSTSQVPSARVINSTGVSSSAGAGGVINSSASIYLSIGNAIPTPDTETIQEVHVNASMYDVSQGSTSGAHIEVNTKSGTNNLHASGTFRRGTDWINAAPFFFNQDSDIPDNKKVPQLHRYELGFTAGGPIIKDKLFGFVAYKHIHASDQEIGDSFLQVPVGLSDARDAGTLADIVNGSFGSGLTSGSISPLALVLFNSPALPGEPGNWLIPNASYSGTISSGHTTNAFLPGTGLFYADLGVADLDWNASKKDTLSAKYNFQHDPTFSPYAYSSVPGFTQHLDSGAQVFSIINTYNIKSNLSTTETIGFIREKNYGTNAQPFSPSAIPGGTYGTGAINTFGSNYFPGISIYNTYGGNGNGITGILNIGPNAEGQAPNTGVFQNRITPSGNAIWVLGKHEVSFGANYSYTQLNTIDKRTGTGTIATDDLSQMVQGYVTPGGASTGFYVSSFLQGNANRYYRANQLGTYVQDKFQIRPNLTLTAGVRYDWDGGLTEKFGRLFNFDAKSYAYDIGSDTITSPGIIIAGNNANGTSGVSKTTLTGRQWGIAPRVGAAWQPAIFHNKVAVRAGGGFYYDRGELFSYFSPGYAIGTVTGGPFGVNQQLPFVNTTVCTPDPNALYEDYLPQCTANSGGGLANPWGPSPVAAPSNPKASDITKYLPNANAIMNDYAQPISLGVYDRANKLPYTINYTFDVQWQPRNDIAIEIGYVGNLGRHQVIPVPFNQPNIASPSNPTLAGGAYAQKYTYGYTVGGATLDDGSDYLATFEGGNVDLRVPYIGYASESISYKAAGVDSYNALTAHVEKRMSHNFKVGFSYTYSHTLDEQSGLGLFYNGNNPLNLRESYGSADFDRKHVLNFNYVYKFPNAFNEHALVGKLVNNWSFVGTTVIQSGQPYSIIDFTGAVGSAYYSTNNGITNPIVPLKSGCTPQSAVTGSSGAWTAPGLSGKPALDASCFTIPLLSAGGLGGAIPSTDPFETGFTTGQRNIFRQAYQKRADVSLIKTLKFYDKYNAKFTFDVFNLTNTTSFDVPGNEVSQNQNYNSFPTYNGPNTAVLPTNDCKNDPYGTNNGFYNCPAGLGVVTHTIGAPRQIQFSLKLDF